MEQSTQAPAPANVLLVGASPDVPRLRQALECAADSIADFDDSSRRWTEYHTNGKHPIVGKAWQDYLAFAERHGAAVRGLRGIKNAIHKELGWLEKGADKPGVTTYTGASSNASFLCALWHHALFSAVNEGPLVALDATFPLSQPASSLSTDKPAKVDIVCNGGKTWVRVASVKPFSLLSEFRQTESYIPGDDHSEDEEDAAEHGARNVESSRSHMEEQLAARQLDSAASNSSLLRLARELDSARTEHNRTATRQVSHVNIVLSRLSLRDPSSELVSKFYDDSEKKRYEMRLEAIAQELQSLDICLVAAEERTFTGETLPRIGALPKPKSWTPTTVLNLDLSALVALVSSISHMPFPDRMEDCDSCFSRVHWKQTEARQDSAKACGKPDEQALLSTIESSQPLGEVDDGSSIQHARALSEQLQREMTGDTFFEALIHHLPIGCGKVQLTCTREAREKMRDIIALVGGEREGQRMQNIFDTNGDDAYKLWHGSRWEHDGPREKRVRESILLPVRIVDESGLLSSDRPVSSSVFSGEFARDAIGSICDSLEVIGNREGPSNRVGIHRQTRHTLTSMLSGLREGHTTLTTNINSVKWLVKDIASAQALRGDMPSYDVDEQTKRNQDRPAGIPIAAMWVIYPRSLSEKMTLSQHNREIQYGLPGSSFHGGSAGLERTADSSTRDLPSDGIEGLADPSSDTAVSADNSDKHASKVATHEGDTSSSDSAHAVMPVVWPSSNPRQGRRLTGRRFARPTRAIVRWMKGPRPRSTLEIKHYRWWPLRRVEDLWLRLTVLFAWKDPYGSPHTNSPAARSYDVEYQGDLRKLRERHAEQEDDEPWFAGVTRDLKINWLHWALLVTTFIGWILGFAFLAKSLWYEASIIDSTGDTVESSVSFFGCTTTLWTANSNCGLNGLNCAPFSSNSTLSFRCPSNCQHTTLGGARAVGDKLPSFVPLVVGGGTFSDANASSGSLSPSSKVYRGDSFICSAAIHAGALPQTKGGCTSLWITGAFSGYEGIERNGIQSTPFNSTFPLSFAFETDIHGDQCTDRRSGGYILDVILLAWVGFVLRPKPIVYYFTLICVGFWHINFISEPREYPPSVGDPMGDFLPTLFIAYVLWRLTFRYVWPAFTFFPLEFNIWLQGFFWLGTLLGVVFVNVPLQRLVLSDIQNEPGALTSVIVLVIVVVILAINQVRVIRKVGALPKYLSLACIGLIIIGLLSAIPTTGLRIHHYIVALVLLPFCAFETRLSLLYTSFLLGMFLNGAGRWGYDGIIQDVSVIIGSGITGSSLPSFVAASNWTGVAPYSSKPGSDGPSAGIVNWNPIPEDATASYDSFQLLVDDVLRLQSSATSFNLSLLPLYYLGSAANPIGTNQTTSNQTNAASRSSDIADAVLSSTQTNLTFYPGGPSEANLEDTVARQPHYLRLAFYNSNSGNLGDFTEAATVFFNGTFVSPMPGAT